MSTVNVQIPNSLHTHLQDLAVREGVTIEQFITTAIAEKMAALMTESYLTERAKRGSRAKYEAVLAQVPDINPKSMTSFHSRRLQGESLTTRATTSRPRWDSANSERLRCDRSRCAGTLALAINLGYTLERKEKHKTMDLAALETEALKLNPRSRARLAEKLLQSLETLSEAENEQLWAEEALRRHEELETDTTVARSGKEVFREARARLS